MQAPDGHYFKVKIGKVVIQYDYAGENRVYGAKVIKVKEVL